MNATVNLPLSELDALRNELKTAQDKVKELENGQMTLKVKLVTSYEDYVAERRGLYGERNELIKKRREVVETVNLDDVIKDLREAETKKVEKTIEQLKYDVDNRDLKIDKLNLKGLEYDKTIKELINQIEDLKKSSGLEELSKAKQKAEDEVKIQRNYIDGLEVNLQAAQSENKALKLKNASWRYHLKMLVFGIR